MNEAAKTAGKGFLGGMFGCFGVLAGGVILIFLLLVMGQCSANQRSDQFERTGQIDARDARYHCVSAGVDHGQGWTAEMIDPVRVGQGTFRCLYRDGRGTPQFLTIEIACTDYTAQHCTRIIQPERP
jgi:hypothetical protein